MNLTKMMLAVIGVSMLSAPAHSGFFDFASRGFKSCTNNCTSAICGDAKKMEWCRKNCNYKGKDIDIDKICAVKSPSVNAYNPNKPLSAKEQALMSQGPGSVSGKTMPQSNAVPFAPKDAPSPPPPSDAPPPRQ